jgi:hypothetical protein
MMPFTREQVMLTLAGSTYRGFADPAPPTDTTAARAAVEAGLKDLVPVQGEERLLTVVLEPPRQGPRGVLPAEVEQELRRGQEEDPVGPSLGVTLPGSRGDRSASPRS